MTKGKVEGVPIKECAGQGGSLGLEDLEWAFPFFTPIGSEQIKVTPIGRDFGEEVVSVAELFEVEEFIFDQAVDSFDIALPGIALGWNEAVI